MVYINIYIYHKENTRILYKYVQIFLFIYNKLPIVQVDELKNIRSICINHKLHRMKMTIGLTVVGLH